MKKESLCSALLLLLVSLGSTLLAQSQPAAPSVDSFLSSGKKIQIERFVPADSERHPAVLVLYGASGLTSEAEFFRKSCRDFADQGYATFLLHYFDATDSTTAGELPVKPERFTLWTKALQDAISYVSRDSAVERNRIGLIGYSLGSFLSLWESSQDPRVKAEVEYYGGVNLFLGPPKRMPATLILHGEKDTTVPVAEAQRLRQLLEEQHAPYEIKLYPAAGHGFDQQTTQDAWNRTLAFFQKYLVHR